MASATTRGWLLLRKAILLRSGQGGHVTCPVHDDPSNAEDLVCVLVVTEASRKTFVGISGFEC